MGQRQRAGEPGVDPSLSLALSRWYIELKLSHLPDATVEPLIEQMAWLIAPNEPAAKEHLDWLAMIRQWPAVIHWSQAQGERLEKWPEVQFRVAEAYRQLGQLEAARRRGMLGLEALPTGLEDGETIAHGPYAMNYPVWGIEVLRHTLEQTDPGTEADWRVRVDAAPVAGRSMPLGRSRRSTAGGYRVCRLAERWLELHSRCPVPRHHAERTTAFGSVGDPRPATLRGHPLSRAVGRSTQADPPGPLPARSAAQSGAQEANDEANWQRRVDIEVGRLQDRIRRIDQDLARFPIPNVKLQLERELTARCVSLANLLCNSVGDAQQAVSLCERALEITPEDGDVWHALAHSLQAANQLDRGARGTGASHQTPSTERSVCPIPRVASQVGRTIPTRIGRPLTGPPY